MIVRTVAEGKRVAELDGELKVLLKHWEEAITKVQKATKFPTLIYEETSRAVGLLRDLFNPSFENIYVCDMRYFELNAIDFCKQVGCTDLLFAMNTFSATGGNESYLESNRVQ